MYGSRAVRLHMRTRKIVTVIPERWRQVGHRQRHGSNGGWPSLFDASQYKQRSVVDRGINAFKNWSGLVTRYDKLALGFPVGAVLTAITHAAAMTLETRPNSGGRPRPPRGTAAMTQSQRRPGRADTR